MGRGKWVGCRGFGGLGGVDVRRQCQAIGATVLQEKAEITDVCPFAPFTVCHREAWMASCMQVKGRLVLCCDVHDGGMQIK